MKKTNKILARVLVIILSLVLITSSVVSSTFAKYVVAKDAKSTIGLQAFGIEVDLSIKDGVSKTESKKGDSVSYTVSNLTLKPGDDYSNLFTASITKTPTVDANVTITVDVTACSEDSFSVNASDFTAYDWGQDATRKYLPIGVYYGNKYVVNPYKVCTTTVETTIESAIITELAKHNSLTATAAGNAVSGTFSKNTEIQNLSNITIGFDWPENYTTQVPGSDEIGTWIAKKTPSFTITYTISVEQDTSSN